MKEYKSASGERRLWFEDDEIESIMQDELQRSGMFHSPLNLVAALETLLEVHLGVKLDLYARLEANLLGVSKFASGRQTVVEINRDLTDQVNGEASPSRILGRWRATLAHEAAHVILHRCLVEHPSNQGVLFRQSGQEPVQTRCLDRNIWFARGPGDWKEVQANRGMASLLMPSAVFIGLVRNILDVQPTDDLLTRVPVADTREFSVLVRDLSNWCQVSQQAASIRLQTLGLTRLSSQPMLSSSLEHARASVRQEGH